MNAMIRVTGYAAMVAMLAGCMSFGPQEPQRYYVLQAPSMKTGTAAARRNATLLLTPTTVSGFYDTQEIVYSRAPGTRAYYQLHAWTERPGPRVTELLLTRLDHAASFRDVAMALSSVRGDWVLDTHLTEFYHDATQAPGNVRVTLVAELTDPAGRKLLARRIFTRTAPVTTYDAPGAVDAFGRAVTVLLDEVAAWVELAAPR
ncbi:MAG: ABC-type transport auxiliary lipoprotein family protein [Betaproteobacteria bacterium]|nr:ABC-type transport auxiliary lipoprotein family protein [Betaproteobacteria bacterium]MDH5343514.1 ABC-type transport auxiliary lipoprotein family protein [Betaproteobacteria bacterium]